MRNFMANGKITSLRTKKCSTGRYMTTVQILQKDFGRCKEQKYQITFFNQLACDFAQACKCGDFVRIIGDLINITYPHPMPGYEIIGQSFSKVMWSNDDKRFLALQYIK